MWPIDWRYYGPGRACAAARDHAHAALGTLLALVMALPDRRSFGAEAGALRTGERARAFYSSARDR
jgi:hypothetical protein